ncbi:MAG TPA: hypothetical protein VM166_07385 [Gemmatimonadaceae bacterium]|nr:hypothetical protein [Gemmatimonadaceae bacterium]
MEYAKTEITILEKTIEEAREEQIRELNDLQLALIGGGGGDVVFA